MGLHTPNAPAVRTANRGVLLAQRGVSQGLVLVISDLLSGLVSFGFANLLLTELGEASVQMGAVVIWLGVWLCWRFYQGLYPGYGKSPQTELRLHTVSTVQVLLVQLAAALAFDRLAIGVGGVVVAWLLILLLALPVRYGVRSLLIRAGNFGRPVSIIGAGQTASLTIAHLQANPAYGLIPLAAYDDNPFLQETLLHGVPVRGSIEQALIDPLTEQALISIPSARAETQQKLVNNVYAAFPVTWVIPDLFGIPNQALLPHNIGSIATLEVRNNLRSRRSRMVKRTMDLLASVMGTLVIAPIFLVIAIAIKVDSPGPAVYRARRLGRDGKLFDCFKFRSMHRDAEAKLQEVLATDPELKAEFEATHKLKDDPRVTRVGNFLRKTSLDEFPQLFNVIVGEMSLVGPRPIVEAEVVKYGKTYTAYKQVRPGMTGYWQANGRSDTSYDERVGMDNFYVTNWTPWLDLVILLQTVRVVLVGKGAY
ncbi:undecaprenyl-phosphate galactose phosphotransferase WbaP [Deinococcus psychrotolerans]|uniref:Undecaprenyl-phosphate galactose phosphotransferase WbaP n=1 Tax=Deinococcus psychrotolerans TaxID=2489213 RepID=A0A3G8Y9P0_9DEIO|nr:undecaprenyl-phosphate galactose phosphotransferase WbaP [Deinococcus psychrotolerans]AZI42079.1 undecaprenyl-phosphate galactose phosphotransferase WbaP [Deinococcus psychrotolerans]